MRKIFTWMSKNKQSYTIKQIWHYTSIFRCSREELPWKQNKDFLLVLQSNNMYTSWAKESFFFGCKGFWIEKIKSNCMLSSNKTRREKLKQKY